MKTLPRIIIGIIILIAAVEGWWFVALPVIIFASWMYPYFFEGILGGLVYDSLFGFMPEAGIKGYYGIITTVILALLIAGAKIIVRR